MIFNISFLQYILGTIWSLNFYYVHFFIIIGQDIEETNGMILEYIDLTGSIRS